ncbi:MAG: hypothetical protein IJB67_03710 [Firmicutes bacterium]|nr:hypothetical protein [Bacillota bacterium]
MKKLLSFALIFGLMLTFAGCGTNTEPTVSTDTGDVDKIVAEEDVLTPIYASALNDGSYPITVDSSSSMFRVVKCELIVENGEMQAVMTMSGDGYGMVYMGTGEEALLDTEENYVPFVLDEVGAKTFTVPVEALDLELDCAAWSIKKEKWYDRVLIFQSDELPADALIEE